MRFHWEEQHVLLRDMLDRYAADRHAFSPERQRAGWDEERRASWTELAELGILGLPFAEEDGGSGGSMLDVVLTMQSFGRGLVVLPYLSAVVMAGGLLRLAGSARQKARYLPGLIGGEQLLSFAFAEPQSRYEFTNVETTATRKGDTYVLSGRKTAVLGAAQADHCIVSARTAGGLSLFIVPTAELSIREYRVIDGGSAAEITLGDVAVPADALLGDEGSAAPVIEQVLAEATVALCADAVGAMEAALEKCIEHARTRQAFGQAIAQFQVIQHRLVDMRLACEMAGAITLKAATQLAGALPGAIRTASAAKVLVNAEAGMVGKNAVQIHGAIGITEELDIGAYFKRLTAMQLMLGSSDHHLRLCAAARKGA